MSAESDVPEGFIIKFEKFGVVGTLYSRDRGFDGLAAIRAAFEARGIKFGDDGSVIADDASALPSPESR